MINPPPATVFHVEARQFPHVGRAFNLSREELVQRILAPWTSGQPLTLDDRRFSPGRARLTIYEGPALDTAEIGLGRGWANAARTGRDVTAGVLEDAQQRSPAATATSELERLKGQVLERCSAEPLALHDVVVVAGGRRPGELVSERLALAERAVWELLYQGQVRMLVGGQDRPPAGADAWRAALLTWDTWAAGQVSIEAVPHVSRDDLRD